MEYCEVRGGEVVWGPQPLPKGRHPINRLMPANVSRARLHVPTQMLTHPTIVVGETEVTYTENVRNLHLSLCKRNLKEDAARVRWEREVGGIDIGGGVIINTERESQSLLQGAWIACQVDPAYTTGWKGDDGIWGQIGLAEVTFFSAAVTAHVTNCFAREEVLHGLADAALDADEVRAIYADSLNEGWPT